MGARVNEERESSLDNEIQSTKTLICAVNLLSRNLPLPRHLFDAVSSIYAAGTSADNLEVSIGKLSEAACRKIFQQLIDGVTYCHNEGVFHRDLKLENVLVDTNGNIKISDFGLSALPQHFRDDGLLHTTCGSPNYVAPEGYDGATSDTWSCGVILYVILTGYLPLDDRNLAVLYQKIFIRWTLREERRDWRIG